MKIQIASDLHLEMLERYFPAFRGVEPTDAAVLVLAGDIAQASRATDLFADWPVPVIYVPGNHEYYGGALETVNADYARRNGLGERVQVLAPGAVVVGDVRFLGCTLWTDYRLFGEAQRELAMFACAQSMPDHRVIHFAGRPFSPLDALALHQEQRAWLASELAKPFAGKTVVITHHAPCTQSLHPMYADDLVSAGFIADLTDLMEGVDLYVHGHTHHPFDYQVGRTRVVANPMGYCKGARFAPSTAALVRENPDFDPRRVIVV